MPCATGTACSASPELNAFFARIGRSLPKLYSRPLRAFPGPLTILKSLPEPERSIVYKHVVEESTWKDLGAEFQMSPEALRKRFERALRRLRESVDHF